MASAAWLTTIFRTSLLLAVAYIGTCQEIAGCAEGYYLHEAECLPCPDHCVRCISSTNCTKCNDNNYGPACQHACKEECTDKCHQVYGYCTYGCVDGQFPVEGKTHCSNCPRNCTICKSSTECILCHSGNSGNMCQFPCATHHCDKCDQYNTDNCLMCAKGYFNKDGRCHSCPDGCVRCYGNNNCSVCKDRYSRLHDGQCIMQCPNEETRQNLKSIDQDEYGVSKRNIDCKNLGRSQEYSFKTTTPCVRFMPCSADQQCSTENNYTDTCAAIMTYECTHMCPSLNGSYDQCERNCSTENRNTHVLSFCFNRSLTLSFGNVSSRQDCLQASGDTITTSEVQDICKTLPLLLFLLGTLTLLILTIVFAAILLCQRRRRFFLRSAQRSTGKKTDAITKHKNGSDPQDSHKDDEVVPPIVVTAGSVKVEHIECNEFHVQGTLSQVSGEVHSGRHDSGFVPSESSTSREYEALSLGLRGGRAGLDYSGSKQYVGNTSFNKENDRQSVENAHLLGHSERHITRSRKVPYQKPAPQNQDFNRWFTRNTTY